MFRKNETYLTPNPLGAALTVYSVIFSFFSGCALVGLAFHLIETI